MSGKEVIFSIQYKDKLPTLEQVEAELVAEAVFISETVKEAAQQIGVSERKVYRVMKQHNLDTNKIKSLHNEKLKTEKNHE